VAGTNHSRRTGETGPAPVFVLVAPQMGENIGAAARAMWNFGLDRMRLVAPRDGWPNPRAEAMASGAGRVLERIVLASTTAEACADLTHVFATTARDRALTKQVLTPERAMAEARAMVAAGERVGILFGPERAGLESADVIRANAVISVPTNPAYGSLNLAQCVLLIAYEWQRAGGEAAGYRAGDGVRATGIEVDRFLEQLVGRLDAAGYFFPEAGRASMTANLGNLFRRAPLTGADVRTLHGVVRALAAAKGPGRKPPE
jgi:tRNA/rRNA methyltransferase